MSFINGSLAGFQGSNQSVYPNVQDADTGGGGGGGGFTGMTIRDEGVLVGLNGGVDTLNFVGAGVTATGAGSLITVTVPGGGAAPTPVVAGNSDAPIAATVETGTALGAGPATMYITTVTYGKLMNVQASGTLYSLGIGAGVSTFAGILPALASVPTGGVVLTLAAIPIGFTVAPLFADVVVTVGGNLVFNITSAALLAQNYPFSISFAVALL